MQSVSRYCCTFTVLDSPLYDHQSPIRRNGTVTSTRMFAKSAKYWFRLMHAQSMVCFTILSKIVVRSLWCYMMRRPAV